MYDIKKWRHIFKLDPAKHISDDDLDAICMSQTDAIMIGGTDDVTEDNVIHLMSRIRRYPLPLVLEISNIESVMPGFDFLFCTYSTEQYRCCISQWYIIRSA